MNKITKAICDSIKNNKWLYIKYKKDKDSDINYTFYWIGIRDFYYSKENKRMIKCDIFNSEKSLNTIKEASIYFDNVVDASLLDFTHFKTPDTLVNKLENKNNKELEYLEYTKNDNDILDYYNECAKKDSDPFQKESFILPGIDIDSLTKETYITLNEEQEKIITKKIIEKYGKSSLKTKSTFDFVISNVLIERNNKKFVVCYYDLIFDPTDKTLIIGEELKFNNTFLLEAFPTSYEEYHVGTTFSNNNNSNNSNLTNNNDNKVSLFSFIEMKIEDFIDLFNKDKEKGISILREGLKKEDQLFNTKNEIMVLERDFKIDLTTTYNEIKREFNEGIAPYPLKAFFGEISRQTYFHSRKEPFLVLYDEKPNIDQISALYNSLRYPVTYVQGPPGTGKTQTILNVILSAFFNEKTVLMSSSNNKPVDGVVEKFNFKYFDKDIPFPFLRLGNKEEMLKAAKKILCLYNMKFDKDVNDKKLNNLFEGYTHKVKELVNLLSNYERKKELNISINSINNFLKKSNIEDLPTRNSCNLYRKKLEEEYNTIPSITNETVQSYIEPVKKDNKFLQYLYFKSLKYILNLKKPRYARLIEICSKEDDKTIVSEFNDRLSNNDNLKLLLEAFPIIFTTNISSYKLGNGKRKFDLGIIDEAAQCSIAYSLLPIARVNSLLLLGDISQLQPVIVLDKATNRRLMDEFNIDSSYDYTTNSIYSVMQNHDNISKSIFLSYHYRCGKNIINFSNKRFYNNKIKITDDLINGEIEFYDVKEDKNNSNYTPKNASINEAKGIVSLIKENKYKNVTVLTPFVNQVHLINSMLKEEKLDNEVKCGSIHTMQGAENDVIILSTSISPKTSLGTYNWIKENSELVNVAVTRAKKKLIVCANKESIDKLSPSKDDDISMLVDYCAKNGKTKIIPNEKYSEAIGYALTKSSEMEFYETMKYFVSIYGDYKVKRDIKLSSLTSYDITESNENISFDSVIFKIEKGKEVPIIAIEIRNNDPANNYEVEKRKEEKELIAKKINLKLYTIPNQLVKDYELIKSLVFNRK